VRQAEPSAADVTMNVKPHLGGGESQGTYKIFPRKNSDKEGFIK
jgi:hypothetical protein